MSGKPNSLLRNLGAFVGHIVHAVKSDPTAPPAPAPAEQPDAKAPALVRATIEEQASPDGKVILRRTTIDEIVMNDEDQDPHASDAGNVGR